MRQADIFLEGEGDAWLDRNRDKLGRHDLVTELIQSRWQNPPKRVLEIGCANGWRLAKLRGIYGCEILGIDPSLQAGLEAAEMRVPVIQSTASALPVSGLYDMVIYAFCLYLTDPQDWLRIAAAGDQVLADGGALIIHDFMRVPCPTSNGPYACSYKHRSGVLAYHIDFSQLWLGNPAYSVQCTWRCGEDEEIIVLRKNLSSIPVLK